MEMLCERDCTGDPIVGGQKVHKAYRRGQLYDIDPDSLWAIHFRTVTPEEAARIESGNETSRRSDYLKPVERQASPDGDLFEKFRVQ